MGKVFVVEDNELNLKLFCDLLLIKGHEFVASKDGIDLLSLVLKEKPDLILMDVQLRSGVSGIELVSKLKKDIRTKNIPIIVITAYAMKKEEEMISKSGCDMYLSKPIMIDQFFQSIDLYIKDK